MSRIAKAAALTLAAGAAVTGATGVAWASADAQGAAVGSPGIISGNVIQVPINLPINLCGNTIDLIGLLNPTFGNTCVNSDRREAYFVEVEGHENHHHHKHHHGRHEDRRDDRHEGHHEGDHHDGHGGY
jgi:ChpA-C